MLPACTSTLFSQSSSRSFCTARMRRKLPRALAGFLSPALSCSGRLVYSSSTWVFHAGPFHSTSECLPLLPRIQRRSEEHTSELQSRGHLVCRLLLEKKKKYTLQARAELIPPARVATCYMSRVKRTC